MDGDFIDSLSSHLTDDFLVLLDRLLVGFRGRPPADLPQPIIQLRKQFVPLRIGH